MTINCILFVLEYPKKVFKKYFYNSAFMLINKLGRFRINKFFTGITMVLPDNCARDLYFRDDTADTESKHQW